MEQTDTDRATRLHTLTSNPTLVKLSEEHRQRKQGRNDGRGRSQHQQRKNGAHQAPPGNRRTSTPPTAHTPHAEPDFRPAHDGDWSLAVKHRRRKRDAALTPYGWKRG